MVVMATSFKSAYVSTVVFSVLDPMSGSCRTHVSAGDSWTLRGNCGSVSCGGHCSFHLGPDTHKVLSVPSKSISQSHVSSSSSMVGLLATSSRRAYAIPKSAAPRAPTPAAVHC